MKKDGDLIFSKWLKECDDSLSEIYDGLLREAKHAVTAHNLSYDIAEDLLHCTLIEMLTRKDSIQKPLHYFRMTLSSKITDEVRREARLPILTEEFDMDLLESNSNVESIIFNVGEATSKKDFNAERILNCFESLTPIKREALQLSVIDGFRNVDIARTLGISEKASAKRVSDAKKAIYHSFNEPEI